VIATLLVNLDSSIAGEAAALFAPSSITLNKGDIVTVHFYNIEKGEPHTFTLWSAIQHRQKRAIRKKKQQLCLKQTMKRFSDNTVSIIFQQW
jgi:plastocyanin